MAAGAAGAIAAAAVLAAGVGAEIALAVIDTGYLFAAVFANYVVSFIDGGEHFKLRAAVLAAVFINRHDSRLRYTVVGAIIIQHIILYMRIALQSSAGRRLLTSEGDFSQKGEGIPLIVRKIRAGRVVYPRKRW